MKWVTRERPKVDRVACPWLIKRFVDPEAEFLYVPPDQVDAGSAGFGWAESTTGRSANGTRGNSRAPGQKSTNICCRWPPGFSAT